MITRLINFLISKLGKSGVNLDRDIPISYLFRLTVEKSIARTWGGIRMLTLKPVFISLSTTIKSAGKINCKGFLSIAPKCYIDALGSEGITIGNGVSIGRETMIVVSGSITQLGKGIKIGNNVGFSSSCYIGGAGGVEIGDDTIFGNFVSVHPENHNFANPEVPIRLQGVNHKGVKIGKGCWIGAKAIILDGSDIGDDCIVAAGAVVSGKFPKGAIIGGVPARIIKMRPGVE